ncbi:LacI family DNA-binding transcriptional regulator [Aliiglaciecola lipolytica]|uniref:HTH-type transcriptional regulator galS n=1 Tax=Aliiglaciecola lipolytica E3 TaxID=1127673 RepID=K6YAW7_9ALTE|nr:LacI family DNA-binding transcriptional regulator [Aliiglaciecola lipolytica]GAC15312.1 HTH-type transcriptional regulator galS [Aliiglaciecola lipolytica E3]
MATIYEVAKLAGVSVSTVSRVLNGRSTVNQQLKAKVDNAISLLSYSPNSVARSLASSRSNSVGILVSEINSHFFCNMLTAVELTLRQANKHSIITVGHNDLEQEQEGVDFLIGRNCDALILHVEALTDDMLRKVNRDNTPIALINRVVPGMEEACISLDNELGGYLGTRHLIESGHTKIAYIAGPTSKVDANQRLAGHKRALKEAGLKIDQNLFYQGNYLESDGVDGLTELLKDNKEFTALVCANDWMASGAITCARDMGLDLPKDLSIIGYDNDLLAHLLYPQLTTLHNPIYDMGEMAAKYILNTVYKESNPIKNLFGPELITRNSVSPLP